MSVATTTPPSATEAPPAKAAKSDRLRHERSLGLRLSAPAFIVMILVTAYPLGYALVFIRFLEILVRILRGQQTGLGLADEAADALKVKEDEGRSQ